MADHKDTQKTGARLRYAASDWLDTLLGRARALQPRVASLYVICDRRGRPMKVGTLREHWDAACKRAGVEDAHFHDLRAAGATEIDQRGGNAQAYLGHKSRQTTEVYLRDRRPMVVTPHRRKA